jgi:hypothetical protein
MLALFIRIIAESIIAVFFMATITAIIEVFLYLGYYLAL